MLFRYLLAPTTSSEVTVCYIVWVLGFMAVNIAWDMASRRTPRFHIHALARKSELVHPASALCSSVLIIVALANHSVRELSEETPVPLLLASLSAILQAVPAICPYKPARAF